MTPTEITWFGENWARLVVALTSTGTLGIAGQFYRVWRKGRTDDAKVNYDGDAAIREHYARELTSLREQIIKSGEAHAERASRAETRYREALDAADERHRAAMAAADEREAACHALVRELRDEVAELSKEILGLRKTLGQTAKSAIILATHSPSSDISGAAVRAADAIEETEARLGSLPHHERTPDL